jgi:hypothetical protein
MIKIIMNPTNNEMNVDYFSKWDKFEVMFYVLRVISKILFRF